MKTLVAAAFAMLLWACASADTRPETEAGEPEHETPVEREQLVSQLRALSPRLAELISQLGSDDYHVRENAKKALLETGMPAIPALEDAKSSLEIQVSHLSAELLEKLEPKASKLLVIDSPDSGQQRLLASRLKNSKMHIHFEDRDVKGLGRFLRYHLMINTYIDPSLVEKGASLPAAKPGTTLGDYLREVADKLDSTWVARFGMLSLMEPEETLEIAGAEIITFAGAEDKARYKAAGNESISLSIKKTTSLGGVLDFFLEISQLEITTDTRVDTSTALPEFDALDIRLKDMLQFILFKKGLSGLFKENKLTIKKADYRQLSAGFRNKRSLLRAYRKAWKELATGKK